MIAFNLKYDLEASKEIQMMLRTLPKRLQSKVMRGALKSAGKVVRKSARSNVKPFKIKVHGTTVDDKMIKSSIKTIIRRGKIDKQLYAVVGATYPKGAIAHWLEYGTLAFRDEPLKGSRSAGAKAAASKGLGLKKRPFMRPAVAQSGVVAQKVLAFAVLKGIQNHVASTLKKGKL